MDVINITPEELRDMAQGFKRAAEAQQRCLEAAGSEDDRNAFLAAASKAYRYHNKLVLLASRMERNGHEALHFIGGAIKGVQA